MLYKPVSESDIYDAVRALRALVKDKLEFATGTHRYDWLQEAPEGGRNKAMQKMLIQFRKAVSSRALRLEVMNIMMSTAHFSTKDLWLAEIYGWLEWMEQEPRYHVILGAISMAPNIWYEHLKGIPEVKRPKMTEPYIPPEEEYQVPVGMDPLPDLDPEFVPL